MSISTVNFAGMPKAVNGNKIMKGLALAGMIAMAAATTGCANPSGGSEAETATPTTPTTTAAGQSPVQTKMIEMLQILGLLPVSGASSSLAAVTPYQTVKGDVTSMSYKTQSGAPYNYELNTADSTSDVQVYTCNYKSSDGKKSGTYTTTVKTTDEGILKRDSDLTYAQLFVANNGKIDEYQIEDATGIKELALTYVKNASDSTKIDIYDRTGAYKYTYSTFVIKTAE